MSYQQKMHDEVMARSLPATIAFMALSCLILVTDFTNGHPSTSIRITCFVIVAANLWRASLYSQWLKTKSATPSIWIQFNWANVINSTSWGTALTFLILQNEASPMVIALVLIITSGIINASIFTLGNNAILHGTFVGLATVPLMSVFFQRFLKSHEPVEVSVAMMLLLQMVYVLAQGRRHRRRFTQRLKSEEALVQSQKDLLQQRAMTEHANRLASLGEMAAGFAHEINNPLAVVSGNLELIKLHLPPMPDTAPVMKHTEKALWATQRIAKIVRSLRTLSYRSSGDQKSMQSITGIIADVLELYAERLASHNVRLSTEYVEQDVWCDPVQITQVLLNLLNNAKDAVEELSDRERWIHLRTHRVGDHLAVSITNGGPQVGLELSQKIFTPFFTTKPVGQGMGLGLVISRAIAVRHGGDLTLQSENGHTCFRLTLLTEPGKDNSEP